MRMNIFIYKTIWRSGVVLKSGGNTALVKADIEDRKIYIWVTGDENTRRDLLSVIRAEFNSIHKTIIKINAKEKVPLPNQPEVEPIDYEYLLHLEREGRKTVPILIHQKLIDVNIQQLLDGISISNLRQEILKADKDKTEKIAGFARFFSALRSLFKTKG